VGLAFRVQEILQDGGLFTGDIVVIVLYFIGKRSLKSTRHHENKKETRRKSSLNTMNGKHHMEELEE
jgi:hypothetical protein